MRAPALKPDTKARPLAKCLEPLTVSTVSTCWLVQQALFSLHIPRLLPQPRSPTCLILPAKLRDLAPAILSHGTFFAWIILVVLFLTFVKWSSKCHLLRTILSTHNVLCPNLCFIVLVTLQHIYLPCIQSVSTYLFPQQAHFQGQGL